MISTETRRTPLPSLLLLCTLVVSTYARSWDLAVVIGSEIDFFARNKTLTGQANIGEAVALTGVTYDDTTRTMYLSDTRNNVSIFSNDLTQKNFTSTPLLKSECPENVWINSSTTSSRVSIPPVFDTSAQMLSDIKTYGDLKENKYVNDK